MEKDLEIKWYVIMPEYRFRRIWNICVLFLLLYTATIVPYRTAFLADK